ncbi:MAG: hypothetical protein JXQ75_11035 [Phycisphaerae bacterium]|nr:hypothetical protein [Phycisphaerae bacterium]
MTGSAPRRLESFSARCGTGAQPVTTQTSRLCHEPRIRRLLAVVGALLSISLVAGCQTYEVRQFDSVKTSGVKFDRAAVIMNAHGGSQTKERNKLFAEQLIVSLQKRGIDVAERQKVESLLVDAVLIERGLADLTETERAKRLGRLLKTDVFIYADAIVNHSFYAYGKRAFGNDAERFRLQQQANETGTIDRQGYPVLANHAIGLSMRAVDTATGEIVWVGYRFMGSANPVDDDRPETLTNFDVVRRVCDEIIDDVLTIRNM